MKTNLAHLSVSQAFRYVEAWGRRLPQLLLIRHIRAVKIIVLGTVLLVGVVLIARLFFASSQVTLPPVAPPTTVQTEKISTIERLLEQRQRQGQRGLAVENRIYFEPPIPNR